nr:hypothetical protein [Paenibacillus thiaminolyticus]
MRRRFRANSPSQTYFDEVDDYVTWLRERVPGADLTTSAWIAMLRRWPVRGICPRCCIRRIGPLTVHRFFAGRDPGKPFFLWMSFVRPHPPFDPPQAYLDMYKDEEIPDSPVGDWADTKDEAR